MPMLEDAAPAVVSETGGHEGSRYADPSMPASSSYGWQSLSGAIGTLCHPFSGVKEVTARRAIASRTARDRAAAAANPAGDRSYMRKGCLNDPNFRPRVVDEDFEHYKSGDRNPDTPVDPTMDTQAAGQSSSRFAVEGVPGRGSPLDSRWIRQVELYTNESIFPAILQELVNFKVSFDAFQYQIDHTGVCIQLVQKLAKAIRVRLILDKTNFYSSSCARQPLRVQELWEAGCEIKLFKPSKAGFASLHTKTVIFDSKIVCTGWVNLTHNGMENNKEHMVKIREAATVLEFCSDFESVWSSPEAEKVDKQMIERMQEKAHSRPRSRSQSVPREVPSSSQETKKTSRSLDRELQVIQEEAKSEDLPAVLQGLACVKANEKTVNT